MVHAGALSTIWGPWEQFYQTNVVGTKLVMEACRHFGVKRLVYISSPSVYAAARDQLAIKEEAAPQENELNFYIKSKLMAERIVRSYPQVPSVILRPRGLFGIGDTSIFPRILRLSQKLAIPLIRNGQQDKFTTLPTENPVVSRICWMKLWKVYRFVNVMLSCLLLF